MLGIFVVYKAEYKPQKIEKTRVQVVELKKKLSNTEKTNKEQIKSGSGASAKGDIASSAKIASKKSYLNPDEIFNDNEKSVTGTLSAVDDSIKSIDKSIEKISRKRTRGKHSMQARSAKGANVGLSSYFSREISNNYQLVKSAGLLQLEGQVKISAEFLSNGRLDEKTLRVTGKNKYLSVFTLRNILEILEKNPEEILNLISENNRLNMTISYSDDPYLKMENELDGIHFGATTSLMDSSIMPEISVPFALEALFSSDFRKQYGWDGKKKIKADREAFKRSFEQLYKLYQAKGWIS